MSSEAKISIETFKTVTKAIAQSDNLDIMTNHLTRLLVSALNIRGCAIFILDPDTKELQTLASFGLSPRYLTKGPLLAERSIAENLKGKAVIVADVTEDKNVQYPEEARREGIAAIASIPIIFLNEVIGSLRLYHHEIWAIPDQDLDSLYLLAENIGLAMTYTRLLNAMHSIAEILQAALPSAIIPPMKS